MGNNALHLAVLAGSADIVKFLVNRGWDLNEKNDVRIFSYFENEKLAGRNTARYSKAVR